MRKLHALDLLMSAPNLANHINFLSLETHSLMRISLISASDSFQWLPEQ
jgi:hypothetical protein